jgi:hypothetical protein
MQKIIVCLGLIIGLSSLAVAQDTPEPVLVKGDVERFIQTYPLMVEKLTELGMKYDAREGDYSLPEAVQVSAEFQAVLAKHGWDEAFFMKMPVILLGYAAIEYKKEMKDIDPQFAQAIKEIESNPGMSEAMKKQMIEQMKAAQGMMKSQEGGLQQSIHPKDLALIGPKIKELKKILEEED